MEIRAFGPLKRHLPQFPFQMDIPKEGITGKQLAQALGIPLDNIECIMADGKAQDLDFKITSCERLAFIPCGIPGPYRVVLGLKRTWR